LKASRTGCTFIAVKSLVRQRGCTSRRLTPLDDLRCATSWFCVLLEKAACHLEIERLHAFGEPGVDSRKVAQDLGGPPTPQSLSRKGGGCAKLQCQRPLALRKLDR
jgi:hypothetical protein